MKERNGLSLIAFKLDRELLEEIDRARGRLGRSAFIRDAIAADLKARGVKVAEEITGVPDRAYRHHVQILKPWQGEPGEKGGVQGRQPVKFEPGSKRKPGKPKP